MAYLINHCTTRAVSAPMARARMETRGGRAVTVRRRQGTRSLSVKVAAK